jgi:hypothetical protein
VDAFLARYSELQLGRAALKRLQSGYSSSDAFSIINKPFRNMVLHQEFDADTKRRMYVVALVDDQEALDYYAEMNDEVAAEESKCDCAEHQGSDHLILITCLNTRRQVVQNTKELQNPTLIVLIVGPYSVEEIVYLSISNAEILRDACPAKNTK